MSLTVPSSSGSSVCTTLRSDNASLSRPVCSYTDARFLYASTYSFVFSFPDPINRLHAVIAASVLLDEQVLLSSAISAFASAFADGIVGAGCGMVGAGV